MSAPREGRGDAWRAQHVDGWLNVGTLRVTSGKLSLADTAFFYDEPLVLDVVQGDYSVKAFVVREPRGEWIKEVRLRTFEARAVVGSQFNDVNVAFGQLGICDRVEMDEKLTTLGDAALPTLDAALDTTALVGEASIEGVPLLFVRPGFGGGVCRVHRVLDGERVVGVDIHCAVEVFEP